MASVLVQFEMRVTGDGVLPNAVAIWVNEHRSGIWCESTGGVFEVKGEFEPMKPTWLCSEKTTTGEVVGNSIKAHFFYQSKASSYLHARESEVRRDFLYATSFPLSELRHVGTHSRYGVFNYNDNKGLDIQRRPGVGVQIYTALPCTIPRGVRVLTVRGPDEDHHEQTCDVGDWVDKAFCSMWPEMGGSWANPRSFFRDFCSTFFYSDICKLFERDAACRQLPPWLACYSLCNALIVNGTPAKTLVDEACISAATCSIPDPAQVALVMRIIKDVLTPWTMCAFEGLYWEDQCLRENVDDQPFPLSFVPSERVFGKDDCEGRSSQAQEMVALLKSMFLYTQSHGIDCMFHQLTENATPCQKEKLRVSHTTLVSLVQGCRKIGMLLYNGIVRVETVVGDADANILSMRAHLPPRRMGHSFGLILYDDGYHKEYMMMENTGWQRRVLKGEQGMTRENMTVIQSMLDGLKNKKQVRIACLMDKAMENRGYMQLFMGHDKLFFTCKRAPETGKWSLRYGASLRHMNRGGVSQWKPRPLTSADGERVFSMSLEQVIRELGGENAEQDRLWAPVEGAKTMLQNYQEVQTRLPTLRGVLMTPQKREEEFEALMQAWHPITEEHMPQEHSDGSGMWMTMETHVWHRIRHTVRHLECSVKAHPFMRSTVVCVRA